MTQKRTMPSVAPARSVQATRSAARSIRPTFKAGAFLLAVSLLVGLARRRPEAGRRVLTFGCAATALVVAYSGHLAAVVRPGLERSFEAHLAAEGRWGQGLDAQARRLAEFNEARARAAGDLVAGRRTLDEAVAELGRAELTRDPGWLGQCRRAYPGQTVPEMLGAYLLRFAGLVSLAATPRRPAEAARAAVRAAG